MGGGPFKRAPKLHKEERNVMGLPTAAQRYSTKPKSHTQLFQKSCIRHGSYGISFVNLCEVSVKIGFVIERSLAVGTDKWFFARVNSLVPVHF